MKFRKNTFTLLEVIISLGLVLLVLSTLGYFYRQVTEMDHVMDHLQKESFELLYLENRLSQILPKATDAFKKSYDHIFVLTDDYGGLFLNHNPSLLFTFDHCIHLDKDFANQVLGRIYLDPQGNLTLGMWPPPKRWDEFGGKIPFKKEILMENVDAIEFSFFGTPQKDISKVYKETPPPPILLTEYQGQWRSEWHWDFEQQPALVKLIIKRKEKNDLIHIFPLPNTFYPIIYEK